MKKKKRVPKPEKMWVVWNMDIGMYVGTSLTRSHIIYLHAAAMGKTWEECWKAGDRAVHVLITPIKPNRRKP